MVLSVTIRVLNERVIKDKSKTLISPKKQPKPHPAILRHQLRTGTSVIKLTEDEERRLRRVYTSMDVRKDGKISADELLICLIALGIQLPLVKCEELLWECQDYPGTFDLDTLRSLYGRGLRSPSEPRRLFSLVLFMMLDDTSNAAVSRDEVFDFLFPKVPAATLDRYMAHLFPKNVDPSGKISAAAFVRTLQSRLWSGTVHAVSDQKHTRPVISVPEKFVDAKKKYFSDKIKVKVAMNKAEVDAGRGVQKVVVVSRARQPDTAESAGILELLSIFKGRATDVKTATGAWNQDVSSTLMELRTLREFSERHGLSMTVVEKIFSMFKIYDSDQSGYIDRGEFRKLLMHVLKVAEVDESDLDRAWRDHGRGGGEALMSLDDFFDWYKDEMGRVKNCVAVSRR
jgi:Ca2+-binding EF-hand superfamily protein